MNTREEKVEIAIKLEAATMDLRSAACDLENLIECNYENEVRYLDEICDKLDKITRRLL